jgi:hypothetical protein
MTNRRPRIAAARTSGRPHRFELSLSQAERDILDRIAEARGLKAADVVRTLLREEDRRTA